MNQTRSHKPVREIFGELLMLLLGLISISAAVSKYIQVQEFARIAQTVKGNVVDFEVVCIEECADAPVVSFVTQTGESILFTSNVSSSPRAYRVNATVDVLYDPQNPQNAEISGAWNSMFLIFGAVGSIFIFLGLMSLTGRISLNWH